MKATPPNYALNVGIDTNLKTGTMSVLYVALATIGME